MMTSKCGALTHHPIEESRYIRDFSNIMSSLNSYPGDIVLPAEVVFESANAIPEIAEKVGEFGASFNSVQDLKNFIVLNTEYANNYLYVGSEAGAMSAGAFEAGFGAGYATGVTVPGWVAPVGEWDDTVGVWDHDVNEVTFNPSTVINLLVSGAFGEAEHDFDYAYLPKLTDVEQHPDIWQSMVKVKEEESYAIKRVSSDLLHLSQYRSDIAGKTFAELLNYIRRYDSLSKSLLAQIGNITFGLPVPIESVALGLSVPEFIERNFDVYWLEFSVTYRDMEDDNLREMVFNVSFPKEYVALELIPIRFGPKISVSEEASSPELTVKVAGNEISVGEFYGRRVTYDVIRPTIVAYGKGENSISWIMREEAISGGSHTFVAIVGIPNGADSIDVAMNAHVKTDRLFGIEGDIAGTEAKAFNLRLNQ